MIEVTEQELLAIREALELAEEELEAASVDCDWSVTTGADICISEAFSIIDPLLKRELNKRIRDIDSDGDY